MGRKHFSEEFKADAVHRVVSSGFSVARVSQALGVGETALRRWIEQAREVTSAGPGDLSEAQRRIAELQKQVAQLEQEKAVLKKSVAFFVKEIDR